MSSNKNSTPQKINVVYPSEIIDIISNESTYKNIIFTSANMGNESPIPLEYFKDFLSPLPNKSWLMRESRTPGMISISFKLNKIIDHKRFALIDKQWVEIRKENVEITAKKSSLQAYDKASLMQLINLIFTTMGLHWQGLFLPSKNQNFQFIKPSMVIEVTAIKVLKEIKNDLMLRINDLMLQKNSQPHQIKTAHFFMIKRGNALNHSQSKITSLMQWEHLFERFENWLCEQDQSLPVDKKRTPHLICPISLSLLKKPYCILESGKVYDYDSLFNNRWPKKQADRCPLTRMRIELKPVPCRGYVDLLNECLALYSTYMERPQRRLNFSC